MRSTTTAYTFLPNDEADAVTHSLCLGCGLCSMVCLNHALSMEGLHPSARYYQKAPVFNASLCMHCGRCAAVCPSNTLYQVRFGALVQKVQQDKAHTVVFFCRNLQTMMPSPFTLGQIPAHMPLPEACMSPQVQQIHLPEGVIFETVRCTGRVGARLMDRLILAGAQRILFFACPHQDCTYHQALSLIDTQCTGLASIYAAYGVEATLHVEHWVPENLQQLEERIAQLVLEQPATQGNTGDA